MISRKLLSGVLVTVLALVLAFYQPGAAVSCCVKDDFTEDSDSGALTGEKERGRVGKMIDFTSSRPGDTISLPPVGGRGDITVREAIAERRSIRDYQEGVPPGENISMLLSAAQGITDEQNQFRSAPSAGATYPLELYLAAEGCLARYIPAEHSLVVVKTEDVRRSLAEASYRQMWFARAPLVFVITAVPSRTEAVYGERADRYVQMEVGCAAENLMLQAVALELGSVAVGAFSDREVSDILSLPEGCEPALIIPVGYPR